jgi:integrase
VPSEVKQWVFELAYLTGVRKTQLRLTAFANVNAAEWVITWRGDQTKTGKRTGVPHVLPLDGRSREIVQSAWAQRQPDCGYLFHEDGKPLGLLRSEWNRACKKAGFPVGRKHGGYVFHNTRHSAITNMSAAGVPDTVATTISGHRTLSVFKRYNIVSPETQRAALRQAETYVQSTGTAPKVTPLRRVG